MFLMKAKVAGQKTETYAEKPIPVERAGGRR